MAFTPAVPQAKPVAWWKRLLSIPRWLRLRRALRWWRSSSTTYKLSSLVAPLANQPMKLTGPALRFLET
jgi:hypothetical protein